MKIALVTGPSSGIGRATSFQLAQRGYHVITAGRSSERTLPVVEEITSAGGSAEFLHLDLASLESCRMAVSQLGVGRRRLDVLVNNAGVGVTRGTTNDGYEIHFGVNHLGHFALTTGLIDALAPGARVVTVSSEMHRRAVGIDFERILEKTKSLTGLPEYAGSKLANILFTSELARRYPETRAYAVHPGFVDTPIIPGFVRPFLRGKLIPPEVAADTVVWCCDDDVPPLQNGGYLHRRQSQTPSQVAMNTELGHELWERSVRFIAG